MLFLPDDIHPIVEALLDATILIVLTGPFLYFLLYRPLMIHISERKKSEKALEYAKSETEKASRAKSDFLSRMSHELRTPMTAIIGFSDVLNSQKNDLSNKAGVCVEEIQSAGWHLMTLIDEVLDISRIEAGAIKLNLVPVDVKLIIEDSVRMISPLAKERDILINTEIETIEKQMVLGDEARIRQIIINLLSNAVKYNSESGKITIDCARKKDNKIHVSITDTGRGISEEGQKILFLPFTRLEEKNYNIQGIGIGLTITKYLIELMDGSVGVISKVGEGSTFWIELPKYQD